MRITIDIDDKKLKQVQRLTGIAKKSPAVCRAVDEYLREVKKRRLISRVMEGRTDYGTSNEELEAAAEYDPD